MDYDTVNIDGLVEKVKENLQRVGSRASLIVIEGWEIGREIVLSEGEHILGRLPSLSHPIDAPSLSRKHAKIVRKGEQRSHYFEIHDLGSKNGTLVNGERVSKRHLQNGDRVQLGEVLFKFVVQDAIDAHFHEQIHRLIHYDQLTGLMTMECFRRRLDSLIQLTGARESFTLAMTDLDGLKRVNDTHGHLAGRRTVKEMGEIIRNALRPQDIAGLYGGDEAIILFPATSLTEAHSIVENIRLSVAGRRFDFHGKTFQVTISQGLAEWPSDGATAEEIIAAADACLYRAKAAGRNCIKTTLEKGPETGPEE